MPRELFRYELNEPGYIPTTYRLVDQRPSGSGDTAATVIERREGFDAMGNERWAPEPIELTPALRALFDALAEEKSLKLAEV